MVAVLVLLGPPGAGKGTQASRLAREVGLPHVSTGDLFRENLAAKTELGLEAKGFMESGRLVPDELVLRMLFDRVSRPDCAAGFILDGFPRTLGQARALDERLADLDDVQLRAFDLHVPDDVLVERAAGRLLCRGCGNIHHARFSPPRTEGVCDACGGELYRRDDDRPEVVRERLAVYHQATQPLVAFYRERGALQELDGDRAPDAVFTDLRDAALAVTSGARGAGGRS